MAETSSGGWVRNAATSAASTRPCASASGAISAASGLACSSTRASASATDISATSLLLCAVTAGLAAALLDQADALDAHAALDRLGHVVDGQAGDRHGGERLHLHAGRTRHLGGRAHLQPGKLGICLDLDRDLGQGQGMTERDQLVRPLRRE